MAYSISAPKIILGVVGAKDLSGFDAGLGNLCEQLGRQIANHDCWLICGGTTGVMEAVPKGVKTGGGFTIGIVPKGVSQVSQKDKASEWPSTHIDVAIFSGLGGGIEGRNKVIAHGCDALIALPGSNRIGAGTRSEIDFAISIGTPVILHPYWQTVKQSASSPGPILPNPPLVDYFADVAKATDVVAKALKAMEKRRWTELTTARR